MKQLLQIPFTPWRFNVLIFFILAMVVGLVVRMVDLTIIERHFLQTQGDARAKRVLTLPAYRGMITDRDGHPFAISTSVYSVWMNPQEVTNDSQHIKILSQLLRLQATTISTLIKRYQDTEREFVYLKRDIPPQVAKKIKSMHLPGIYLQQDYKRFYPEGEVAAHVVGFTNVDDKGQEGLELAHDQWLVGTPGKEVVMKDRLGRVISSVQNLKEKKPGNDLTLSINRQIQYLAYRELMTGVQKNQAESGSVVVLDVKTGEVLAMVNQPSFNPNNRTNQAMNTFRNRAVTDVFEPGSTIKAFSIASALDAGQYTPNTVINTFPGWIRVGHTVLKDEHNNGPLTITQILQLSSNVGVTKVILSLPPNQLWNLLNRVGFGETTGIGFPGERSGELTRRENWKPIELATLAFGYGLSVTTLQLAQAYAVIANHGVKVPLSLLLLDKSPIGKRVINATVADQVLGLLESVVGKGGTGSSAHIHGYRIAGKTGTAWITGPKGYEKHRYVSSFVGIAPVSNPRFVVAVVIRDPQGKNYLGGHVSAPVFKKIMESLLQLSNIPPDEILKQG